MTTGASRFPTERDLRGLSTESLLKLITEDIHELDRLRSRRRAAAPAVRSDSDSGPHEPQPPEEEPPLPLHAVYCCGSHLGDFVAVARVRCPFCQTWHRAGSSPPNDG